MNQKLNQICENCPGFYKKLLPFKSGILWGCNTIGYSSQVVDDIGALLEKRFFNNKADYAFSEHFNRCPNKDKILLIYKISKI